MKLEVPASRIILVLLSIYIGGYFVFREFNQQVWSKDNNVYVIFPKGIGKALYYFWRPLTYADGYATGMDFHIGPHID
jgi:hypothetical protein